MSDALIEALAKALHDTIPGSEAWMAYPNIRKHYRIKACAALSAIEAAGFRIVPVEPTEEMAEKARNAIYDSAPSKIRARSVYAAMLSAAPKITEGGE